MDNQCKDSQNNEQQNLACSQADQARGTLAAEAVATGAAANARQLPELNNPPVPSEFRVPMPLKAEVKDDTLHLEVNVLGLVKGGIKLGGQMGVTAGSDILQTDAEAGVALNRNHIGPNANWSVFGGELTRGEVKAGITPGADRIRIGAAADASALGGNINTGTHGGIELGQERLGPYAGAYGGVGPAGFATGAHTYLSDQGLRAGASAGAGIDNAIGLQGQARAGLGTRNELHVDVRGNLGENALGAGAGLYPQVRPDAYIRVEDARGERGAALYPPRTWDNGRQMVAGERGEAPIVRMGAGEATTAGAGVEVRAVSPQPVIETRALPNDAAPAKVAEARGSDGLTMDERAAAYHADRAQRRQVAAVELGRMFSEGGTTSQQKLSAAFKAASDSGLASFTFTDHNGQRALAKIEKANYGINDTITISAIDAHGRKHLMMRGVQMDNGSMVQQKGKDGNAVSFESSWWQKNHS